jgi:O-methyltransferase involved in polyketide biosynthesis
MTAIVSAFALAYHSLSNDIKIYDDIYARQLLNDDYENVASSMMAGKVALKKICLQAALTII